MPALCVATPHPQPDEQRTHTVQPRTQQPWLGLPRAIQSAFGRQNITLQLELVQHQNAQLSHTLKPHVVGEQGGAAGGKHRGDLERIRCA
jgi:hypothetical protein